MIPHGVETDYFYPIQNGQTTFTSEDRRAIKKKVFPQLKNPEETFIVFNGNRIDPRKAIDVTIQGFAEFAKDKPKGVKLYIHKLSERDLYLNDLIKDLEISDRVIREFGNGKTNYANNAALNQIYNACDVGINTCTA